MVVWNVALALGSVLMEQFQYEEEVIKMPNKNGTGPLGQGPRMGRGMGRGAGRGRMSVNRAGVGPGGNCICPACGKKVAHQAGMPCASINCPKCGTRMIRE